MTRAQHVVVPLTIDVSHSAPLRAVRALYERLFADFQTPILNYLYRLLGDPALAEDLTQETFTRAWKARSQLPSLDNPRAWLYRIATNAARDHLRRARLITWLPLLGEDRDLSPAGPETPSPETE